MIYFSNFVHCLLICVPVTRWCASVLCPRLQQLQQQPINLTTKSVYNDPFVCVSVHAIRLRPSIQQIEFEFCPSKLPKKNKNSARTKSLSKPNRLPYVCSVASSGTLFCRGKSLSICRLHSQSTPNQPTNHP